MPDQNWQPRWKKRCTNLSVGGIAANSSYVICSDRDTQDGYDVWRCQRTSDGSDVWTLRYPAAGELDYGNSPRATPTLTAEHAYLLGAMGHLHCVEIATGKVIWKRQLLTEFKVTEKQVWGFAASPLLYDNKLIVNPGAKAAALVALDPATGERLWKHIPEHDGDFHVPTPILCGERLLISTENNGTRLLSFDQQQLIQDQPVAQNMDLAPDTHTPVLVGSRLYGVWSDLHCLDTNHNLKSLGTFQDRVCKNYASLIGSSQRLLMLTQAGELLLLDITKSQPKLLSRVKLTTEEIDLFAHPAIVGQLLYVRIDRQLRCYELPWTK